MPIKKQTQEQIELEQAEQRLADQANFEVQRTLKNDERQEAAQRATHKEQFDLKLLAMQQRMQTKAMLSEAAVTILSLPLLAIALTITGMLVLLQRDIPDKYWRLAFPFGNINNED